MTRILIVDGDTDVLRLLRIKLGAAGYNVDQARDGQEALALANTTRPDVILMERLLPDGDGLELMAQLQMGPTPSPLILVLSDSSTDEEIAAALTAGATDYVLKPFSPQGVLERIRINLIRAGATVAMGAGE